MLSENQIKNFESILGDDIWVLRDLDFFPERLSDVCRMHPEYTSKTLIGFTTGNFVCFNSEEDALNACIKIYEEVLGKPTPHSILVRYWKLKYDRN